MLKHVKSALLLSLLTLNISFLSAENENADRLDDQFEYDLSDRMRSGKVFHDRSYPPAKTDPDYYWCPECQQYHRTERPSDNNLLER